MVLLHCIGPTEEVSKIDWPTVLASWAGVIVGIAAVIAGYLQSERSYKEKKIEEKRALISRRLDEFYGPIIQLREKSNKLYDKFRKKHFDNDPNFATLTYLLNNFQFEQNDQVILKEIIDIGTQTEKLIHDKAGLIDDNELRDTLLPKATTHFLLIRLAFNGALTGNSDDFKDLTFPRDLDAKLRNRKDSLEKELRSLLS